MAQTVKDYREFVALASQPGVTRAIVKKNVDGETKFKLRGVHKVYTLSESDQARAQKIIQTLPPDLDVVTIETRAPKSD